MDKPKEIINSVIDKAEQFGKTSLELIKLKTVDKTADIASSTLSWLIIIIFGLLFFSFLNIGIALWIGSLLGKNFLGFLIVSGFYGILFLIFLAFRKTLLKKPVNDSIVENFID